jgi:carboxyl-terminal processing protease
MPNGSSARRALLCNSRETCAHSAVVSASDAWKAEGMKQFTPWLGAGILCVGVALGRVSQPLATASAAPAAAAVAAGPAQQPTEIAVQWGRVLGQIERSYVDPVDRQRLSEGAIAGMVAHLDPHSAYLDREEYTLFKSDNEGTFGGVGIEVDVRSERIVVIAPIEGGPAERAGVRSGDEVVAIEGQAVEDANLAKLMQQLRGAPGTSVHVTVKRPGQAEPIAFTLVRAVVRVASVRSARLAGNVAYIRILQFQERTAADFARAAERILSAGPVSGVVLDLRANPGGIVDEATAVADAFMPSGTIYSMRARGVVLEEASAQTGGVFSRVPVVALVNEWSASAAELLAGALQDSKRATVVGMPTFGKGSVQTIYDLPGGAGLKLTTARYYTPLGHAIQGDGVHPDVRIVPTLPAPPGAQVVRESELAGRLSTEAQAGGRSERVVRLAVAPGDVTIPREPNIDPRAGTDLHLRLAYETLLGVSSAK